MDRPATCRGHPRMSQHRTQSSPVASRTPTRTLARSFPDACFPPSPVTGPYSATGAPVHAADSTPDISLGLEAISGDISWQEPPRAGYRALPGLHLATLPPSWRLAALLL